MKVCLNGFVGREYLEAADEIKLPFYKMDTIEEIHKQYPDKTVVVEIFEYPSDEIIKDLKMYNGLLRGNLKVCASALEPYKSLGLKVFMGYPITDFYTLDGLKNAGVSDVRVAGPLIFNLQAVKNVLKGTDISIRVTPNVAYTDGLPHPNGICGGWIRPENLADYDDVIDIIEFEDVAKAVKEEVLYRIYFIDKQWLGDLNSVITNLGVNFYVENSALSLMEKRKTCKQTCMSGGICHLCESAIQFANKEVIDKIR